MEELAKYYKAYLQTLNKSPHTIKQYGIDTRQFIQFMNERHHTFKDSIRVIVEEYIEYLTETYSSAASINRKKASLHHFLSFLMDREIVDGLPEEILKPIKTEKTPIQTLTNTEVSKVSNYWFEVYKAAEDSEYKWIALRNFCLVNFLIETGAKPSEVVGMKWANLNGNEITIIQGKKVRKLFLSKTILKWLDLFKSESEDLLPRSREGEFIWLGLGNKQNEHITVKTIERIFQKLSKDLDIKVTATTVRYTLIDTEVKRLYSEQLEEIYSRYGYSRKSVLKERLRRMKTTPLSTETLS